MDRPIRFDRQPISLCGDIRRQNTTVARIAVLSGVALNRDRLKKLMTVS